jgi:lysozyme family protein
LTDEKVLDVPAFDMTDAALNPVQSTTSKKRSKTPKPTGRPDGSVGQATFEAINKMTADGKLTKQAAFAAYGERTHTKPVTVSANYYRVARADGARKPRKQRPATASKETGSPAAPPRRPGRPRRTRANTDLDAALGGLLASVETLAAVLKEQQSEAAALRQQLDALGALL